MDETKTVTAPVEEAAPEEVSAPAEVAAEEAAPEAGWPPPAPTE